MRKKQLGKSDLFVSELTLGCMSLGTNKSKAKNIIDEALDRGINHLDTADLYDFGLNEEIVGEAIQDKREDLILTTKVGNHFNKETKKWFWDPSKDYILDAVKSSLKRLNTDYIDFYMLHGGTLEDPTFETIEAFEQLKKEGLIRAYGISSIRPNVIRHFVEHSSIDGVMTQYSLLDRRPEEEILDLLHRNQISVLARGPLAKGMLSNQSKEQIKRKGSDGYLDYTYEELDKISDYLGKMSSESLPTQELAIQYILQHPAVTTVVFGASSPDQIIENTNLNLNQTIPEDIYRQLKSITKPLQYENHR